MSRLVCDGSGLHSGSCRALNRPFKFGLIDAKRLDGGVAEGCSNGAAGRESKGPVSWNSL